jgi:hypothetical protein
MTHVLSKNIESYAEGTGNILFRDPQWPTMGNDCKI